MTKYDFEIDVNASNTSHAQMLDLVGFNKRVLDVGCSTGYLARAMTEQGCVVSGIELDSEAGEVARPSLEQLVIGDLEDPVTFAAFEDGAFDVVVFGDVLEHLRDPLTVLRQVPRVLRPAGSIVVSIPNIGHGDVRLALLAGQWRYTSLGLLDETHLRFFTRESVSDLLRRAGFAAVEFRRVTAELFGTELGINREDYPADVIEPLLDDPETTTYQFVVRAVLDGADHLIERMSAREHETHDEIHALRRQVARLTRERDALIERAEAEGRRADEEAHIAAGLRAELHDLHATKTMRALRRPRAAYQRLRQVTGA